MLTLERTKEILNDPAMPDLEAQEIRNALYALADLMIDNLEEIAINKTHEHEQRRTPSDPISSSAESL